jgi:EpsD family peptidyl-prolyl cis-trans isomerase
MWAAVAIVLSSCGKPDISGSFRAMASRDDGEDVPARRIDSVLARSGDSMTPPKAGRTAAADLERISDESLLAQEAVQARLDRGAQVAQAIEQARRRILAQAYIEQAVNAASPAGSQQVNSFYAENPALFARRRIYRVLELAVAVAPELSGAVQRVASQAKNLDEVVRWLNSRKLPFETARPVRTAEQIPMNVLRRLFQMRDGQIAVFPTPHGVSVVMLEQTAEAPLSEEQARPAIGRYLLNLRRLEITQEAVLKLRARNRHHQNDIETVRQAAVADPPARMQSSIARTALIQNTTEVTRLR